MKFINYLQEEYLSMTHGVSAFISPTVKELTSIPSKEARFFINFKEKVIVVWDANTILHYSMLMHNKELQQAIKLSSGDEWHENLPNIFSGYGDVKHGKIINMKSEGIYVYKKYEDFYKTVDDKWTAKWFGEPLSKYIIALIEEIKKEDV